MDTDPYNEKYGPRQTEDELRAMAGRRTNWNNPDEVLRALGHTAQLSREIQVVEEFGGDVDALAAEVVLLRGQVDALMEQRDRWRKSYDLAVQAMELATSEARSLASR